MTVDELKKCDKPYLLAADVAPFIGCDPQGLRVQARRSPNTLGFPVCLIGNRVKFPTLAFKRYAREELGII